MRSSRRVPVLTIALGVLLGFVLTSCGIPLDDQPQVIASEDLPRVLQPDAVVTTSGPPLPVQDLDDVLIYLVDPTDGDNTLVPVERQVAAGVGRSERERATLQHLLDGPSQEEQATLTTFVLPAGDDPIMVVDIQHPAANEVSVVLSESPAIEGGDRVTSFAQIVYTLTEDPANSSVSFFVQDAEGEVVAVPVKTDTEEGDVTRPVSRADYSTLRPDEQRVLE